MDDETSTDRVTLIRYVAEHKDMMHATGAFMRLLNSMQTGFKQISSVMRRTGLFHMYENFTGGFTVGVEEVKPMDLHCNEIMINNLKSSFSVAAVVSEENKGVIVVHGKKEGKYIVAFDPVDGSRNVDCNITVGTIFGIYRKKSEEHGVTEDDFLNSGRAGLAAAGYCLYGCSTMLVLTTRVSVEGFVLDESIGEFVLTHPNIRMAPRGKGVYSINEGYEKYWDEAVKEYVDKCKKPEVRWIDWMLLIGYFSEEN